MSASAMQVGHVNALMGHGHMNAANYNVSYCHCKILVCMLVFHYNIQRRPIV